MGLVWWTAAAAAMAAGLETPNAAPADLAWQPRARSISVERVADAPGNAPTGPVLRVRGRIETGWNYVVSSRLPIEAGKLYRLSARLRVDRLGPGSPMPYLKCEFVTDDPRRNLGQAHTEAYDGALLGKWQLLVGEFRVPSEATACWLALEKGTKGRTEIDALLGDVRLEPIPRLAALQRYRLKPIPARLEKLRGVHPRIYLTEHRIAELREAIHTTHAGLWEKIRRQADRAVKRGPPPYIKQDSSSGDEQLWQREVGNTLPLLAMAYVLSGQKQYLASARQWSLASCGYKTWGLGRIDGMDLAAGHQLFGLGLVYDWCYRDLDEAARQEIRRTLVKRTSAMYEAAATGKVWWHRSYLQNHLWVNITGMAISGLALFDEVDDAAGWIGLPLEKFRRTMDSLGPDGASHEGVGYWEYGVEYMLKFMDPARALLGADLYGCDWWRNTSAYALYLMLPRKAWTRSNCIVDIADCPRGHWYGPDYLLRGLARQYRDGNAQWLAQEIDAADVAASGAPWLNLLWYDPTLPAKGPEALPTLRHFEDLGIVSARSDWSGNESLLVFKCGPFIGHQAMDRFAYDPGGGHVHPDANHFVLFGNGQWLVRDDGYRPKWTGQHNTLLVNSRGQLGEGEQWFRGGEALARKANPKILRAVSTPTLDDCVGDATAAYPAELGLKRFVRHLLFLKPGILIVADDIEVAKDADLELRFHPEREAVREGRALVARGKQATLRIEPLTPEGVHVTAQWTTLPGERGRRQSRMFEVRLATHRSHWRTAAALSWSPAGEEPAQVSLRIDNDRWTFAGNGRTTVLHWSTGKVELRQPARGARQRT